MIEIKVKGGVIAMIDDIDAHLAEHRWYLNRGVDGTCYVRNKPIGYLHRLVLNAPKGKLVDHINGDTLDNRRANLRIVDAKVNSINRPRNWRSTSNYKGVTTTGNQNWRAQIKNDRQMITIGTFTHASHAAVAYDLKAIALWGDVAVTNFPREILKLIDASELDRVVRSIGVKRSKYEKRCA